MVRKAGFEPAWSCDRQPLKLANMGRPELDIDELRIALRDLAELRLACLQALGYEREHAPEPT